MEPFKGTFRLIRLALRRDRIKLPLWIALIIGMNLSMLPALQESYGEPKQRELYASSMSTSVAGRMFGGILDGSSIGAILMVEAFLFMAILMAFMSTLSVIRHTRFNEELGSTDLMQSAQVGRYATLSAALAITFAANAVVVIISGIVMSAYSVITPEGAWLYNIALGLVGFCFAGIAALVAQLNESTKFCNMLAGIIIGLSAVIRGVGDGLASVPKPGEQINSTLLSWFSPIGWGQQTYPFTRQNWWVLIIPIFFTLLMIISSFLLLQHRDVGAGIIPDRLGRARAKKWLLSIYGLSWRLYKTTFIAWIMILIVLAAVSAIMSEQFKEVLQSSDIIKQYLAFSGGGTEKLIMAYHSAMISVSLILITAFSAQIIQRVRSEESSGYLESILGTRTSRFRWLGINLLMILMGVTILTIIFGISYGLASMAVLGDSWSIVWEMLRASLSYIPAISISIGIGILAFGLLPSLTAGICWGVFIFTMIVSQLGNLFKFPEWVMNLSPFTHVPMAPSENIKLLPLAILTAIFAGLIVSGFIAFNNRNISNA